MPKEKKILLVEDNEMIRTMYETSLKKSGYSVITADNGADGLKLAKKEKPDVILLDVILPQLDGFSVLQELRADKNFKKTPIVMLTSLGTSEDKDKGIKMGATDYLIKPNLTPAQVSEAVKKYFKNK